MYLWTQTTPKRDGDLDSDILWHEYGHGLTWRMIGGMSGALSGAVGEGMSDVLSIYMNDHDVVGEYSCNNPNGIRSAPYTNYPRTYGDFSGSSVHFDGEIYAATMWRLQEYWTGAGVGGRSIDDLLDVVVDGMNYTASGPAYEDMRDGILSAMGLDHEGVCYVWNAFADFGIGEGASGSVGRCRGPFGCSVSITESFDLPPGVPDEDAGGDCSTYDPTNSTDTTAPAAPTNLAATAGDGTVGLDWDDNDEPDLAGYNVYRSGTTGGPYGQINGSLVAASAYTDNSVDNGTTYYYVVTAIDTSSNQSGNSNESSATPEASGGGEATTMHVQEIVATTEGQGGGVKKAQATVTIWDNLGNPVSGADVTATFTGGINESVLSVITGADGKAVLVTTQEVRGRLKFTVCVDAVGVGVTGLGYTHVEVCAWN